MNIIWRSHPAPSLSGTVRVPGDKSISHRAIMLGALADGTTHISGFLEGEDCLATMRAFQAMGVAIEHHGEGRVTVHGAGLHGLRAPTAPLDVGNSGTSMRLLAGVLAGQPFNSVLVGDSSLMKRPMRRVTKPLALMGAEIATSDAGTAPLVIHGRPLRAIEYTLPVASAQLKSALLLAGLFAEGTTRITETGVSRDHSERMLKAMGAQISRNGLAIEVAPLSSPLKPLEIFIPNDPSSAFFFAVAAAITPGSRIVLKNMLLNKTRIEAYEILKRMGAEVKFHKTSEIYEQIGDIEVAYAPLHAVEVSENISWLIDEAPALAIAFACAQGSSVLRNAAELRVKECDRIKVTCEGLRACGIKARELQDGWQIEGGEANAAIITPCGDHRIAMSFAILGLRSGMIIEDSDCIATSFPNFAAILRQIGAGVED